MRRILCTLLAMLLIFALVGCGSNKREIVQITLSTEDSEAILAAAGIRLPDVSEAKGANTVVKWFSHFDGFHNYAEDEIVNTGFWTFKEKYGGEVEWIETTYNEYADNLANLIISGNAPDFTHAGAWVFPAHSLQGLLAPANDYIDYDDPLWSGVKDFAYNYTSLNGKIYSICTDISFGQVCAYNKRVVDEFGFDDPAQLFANDEWTWDVFYDMCVEFSNPDEDRYALDGWGFYGGLMDSSGAQLVYYDTEESVFKSNVDDPRLERAANLLYDLNKNECVYPFWEHNWSIRGNLEGTGFKEGLCLFMIRGTWTFTGPVEDMSNLWGDIAAGELMFVPMPRDPNGNGYYYTDCNPAGYAFVKGGNNQDAVALLASCERFKIIDPTVISIDERQKREIYLWNDDMMNMYETCYQLANSGETVFAYRFSEKLQDCVYKFTDNGHLPTPQTWAQLKEANTEALEYYMNAMNEAAAKLGKDE